MVTLDLYDTLQDVWQTLCKRHDVTSELPNMQMLFESVDLSDPRRASEALMANMLSEVIECVGRFSPWYKRPAQAYGLARDQNRWVLTTEALRCHRAILTGLSGAIGRNIGVILAARWVDDLERQSEPDAPCVMAQCCCTPPRAILVDRNVIADCEIICDACRTPFRY